MVGKLAASVVVILALSVSIGSATTDQHAMKARNGLIAFAGWQPRISPQIMVVRPDGTGLRALTKSGGECRGIRCGGEDPAFSPDGRKLAFSKGIIDLASGQTTKAEWGRYDAPSWSPTGREIVADNGGQLVVYGMKGGSRVIHRSRGWIGSPTWSPTGALVAFTYARNTAYDPNSYAICGPERKQIYTISPAGKGLRRLTVLGNNVHPTWSPDGSRLAYIHIEPRAPIRLVTMRADGSDKRVVGDLTGAPCWDHDMGLTWSPDGRKFASVLDRRIATFNLDLSDVRFLADGQGSLDWQRLP